MVYSGWQDADIQNRGAEPAWQGKLGAGRGREVEEGMIGTGKVWPLPLGMVVRREHGFDLKNQITFIYLACVEDREQLLRAVSLLLPRGAWRSFGHKCLFL